MTQKVITDPRALKRCLLFAAAFSGGLILSGEPVLAASSDWVETEGGRIRLTALAPDENGSIRAVLDVDLLPGWKTYWRDPGDAGVPPSVGIDGSTNIKSIKMDFPPPERVDDGYSIWAGYIYPVAFPLTLAQERAGESSVLEAAVFLGICESICIPFQTHFSVAIDADRTPSRFETRRVEKAYAGLPEASGEEFRIVDSGLSDDQDALVVSVAHPASNAETEVFLTGPTGWYFDIPKNTRNDGEVSTFRIPIVDSSEGQSLSGQSVQLLVKAAKRSIETQIRIPWLFCSWRSRQHRNIVYL